MEQEMTETVQRTEVILALSFPEAVRSQKGVEMEMV
jgi:hypothetical protein